LKHDSSLRRTQRQFGRQAQHYAESSVHAQGDTLQTIVDLASPQRGESALDVGTGAGFTAFSLAQAKTLVVATDITREMLETARRLAGERGLDDLRWALAAAEALPFGDGVFDIVTCRLASHHFDDLRGAMREFARVTRTGGRVVLCDTVAPEGEGMETFMNQLELRRDRTHVWDYPASAWPGILEGAGLRVEEMSRGKTPQEFFDWVQKAATPAQDVQALLRMFALATPEQREALRIRWEGDNLMFEWDNIVVLATKGG
jgi:ubiquinone/menaquinone biosynthesis C-methylase UbiE